MAVVLLAPNGDGLGHLARVTIVANALASVGERPVIFSQGIYPLESGTSIPGKCVPSLRKADGWMRRAVAAEVQSAAEISLPSVLVEDTHPNPIALPPWIRRILLVRPPAIEHVMTLRNVFGHTYARFLVCDHPDSPTWPYTEAETKRILGWREWQIVGPIYRAAPQAEIWAVRGRYGINDADRVCVFSMGGGGRHLPGDTDAERFVREASRMTAWLRERDPRARAIFVKGPYFPEEAGLDPILNANFEVVGQEPQMPALLACAHAAVIRAGFNTPWECMRAGTPFFPFEGTTAGEPVCLRMDRMRGLGLLADDFETLWCDESWRADFRGMCERIVSAHSGQPDALLLKDLIVGETSSVQLCGRSAVGIRKELPVKAKAEDVPGDAGPESRVGRRFAMPLLITIEEAASVEPALEWLLELFASRGLRVSLGVVPYLVNFDETFLDRFDPARRLFGVSQHGYARLPRGAPGTQWREFSLDGARPEAEELNELNRGRDCLIRLFPSRWNGGFSAPFEAMFGRLAAAWRGGFVMGMAAELSGAASESVPTLETGVRLCRTGAEEMADPRIGRERFPSRSGLRMRLAKAALGHGYAGIVVTPRALRSPGAQVQFTRILDDLIERGIETLSHAETAARAEKSWPRASGYAVYRWALTP